MSIESLQKEIAQVQQAGSKAETTRFLVRHPVLSVIAAICVGGVWLLRAILWTLLLLLAVVGLKVLWLAVQYMWGLV